MVFDETTKSAPYSLLKDFSQRWPLFYLKKGTAWQDLPLNSFLGEFKSPQTRRSSQNIFSKFTLFLKIKKPQQLGTVGVQPTISELLRFSGGGEGNRTPVRKHFNGTFSGRRRLLRESFSLFPSSLASRHARKSGESHHAWAGQLLPAARTPHQRRLPRSVATPVQTAAFN